MSSSWIAWLPFYTPRGPPRERTLQEEHEIVMAFDRSTGHADTEKLKKANKTDLMDMLNKQTPFLVELVQKKNEMRSAADGIIMGREGEWMRRLCEERLAGNRAEFERISQRLVMKMEECVTNKRISPEEKASISEDSDEAERLEEAIREDEKWIEDDLARMEEPLSKWAEFVKNKQ
ncbi:unnamed protein product [Caenorhabditis sp. 36 PRJEB53466]|nr:unnamed protein product [Caenorhabditis sp. 36 PRJEB53466]